ncbi:hypothetical protein LX36DRAFT_18350 [Colletotrichum falcatum]|nr:hypothetical protein LX36DRAFT_18350 [Colletotrichum falcatum]
MGRSLGHHRQAFAMVSLWPRPLRARILRLLSGPTLYTLTRTPSARTPGPAGHAPKKNLACVRLHHAQGLTLLVPVFDTGSPTANYATPEDSSHPARGTIVFLSGGIGKPARPDRPGARSVSASGNRAAHG